METGERQMSMGELSGTGSRFENSIFSPRPLPLFLISPFSLFELCYRLFPVPVAMDILYKAPCTLWMSYGRLCLALYPPFFLLFFLIFVGTGMAGRLFFCIKGFLN